MIRNLVSHILPKDNGKWRRTVAHLRSRMELFNGKRVVSVATADDCDSPEEVRSAFGSDADSIEWLTFPNDCGLREVVSFVPMLERVASLNKNEITFVCHSKGATHGHDDSICHLWADLMFATCLDVPELVDCALQSAAICGSFRTGSGHLMVPWHFSGTFYWIRHDATFSRNWRNIRRHPFGTESWPGLQFAKEESACLFLDNCGSPYDESYWETSVLPAYRYWQERLRACGLVTTPYSPPSWFLERHPNFRDATGPAGSATTAPAKKNWRRIGTCLRRAVNFSRG